MRSTHKMDGWFYGLAFVALVRRFRSAHVSLSLLGSLYSLTGSFWFWDEKARPRFLCHSSPLHTHHSHLIPFFVHVWTFFVEGSLSFF